MRVTVNRDTCCSAGICVLTAPDIFDHDEDVVVVLRRADVPLALRPAVREAANRCPTQSISIQDTPRASE
jgi:ferredoxin